MKDKEEKLYVAVFNTDGRYWIFGTVAYADKNLCRKENREELENLKLSTKNQDIGMVIHELVVNREAYSYQASHEHSCVIDINSSEGNRAYCKCGKEIKF